MTTESVSSDLRTTRTSDDTLLIHLEGDWTLRAVRPSPHSVLGDLRSDSSLRCVRFDAEGLSDWDSSLLTFLLKLDEACKANGLEVALDGLPEGAVRLLGLASAVPERKGARRGADREPFFSRVGESTLEILRSATEMLAFIGEAFLAFLRLLVGKASFRRSDLVLTIQQVGADALPIVSLISLLVGLILAFVGAVQLMMFGAQIFVANLVGIAMVRVMGAVMVGIIMAGRTGASFAAQLGTMQVNEEIDALKTLGISPMEFLVMPRMLALVIMMPLLCVYADLMGVLGGLIVGVTMLDLSAMEYLVQSQNAIGLTNFWIGLFHSAVFGVLVALAGCLKGMQCGRSSSAVGYATTSAVVTSIVWIVVATALITIGCNVLGI